MKKIETISIDFDLPFLDGRRFTRQVFRKHPENLLIFYKQSCPSCHFVIPYLNWFYQKQPTKGTYLLLVSQDYQESARAYCQEMELEIPVAVDYPEFQLSRYFDFYSVPAAYLINSRAEVLWQAEGMIRDEYQEIFRRLVQANGLKDIPLFPRLETIPPLKPG